jgi:uncharacterized membrane protein YgdD (TMEM256/DUF423 family)
MKLNFVSIGAACAALGVIAGAFGAHSLRGIVGEPELAIWDTATRYWFVGSLGMLAFGLFQTKRATSVLPGVLLLAGSCLFSFSLYALTLGAPRAFGAVTPIGGLCLIAGFASFAWLARLPP